MTVNKPFVYIILLNYCGAAYTLDCIKSLQQSSYLNAAVVVVDNASPDDSLDILQDFLAKHPGAFTLVESTQNNGYSAGNNVGIRFAQEDALQQERGEPVLVWLLNNDTLPKEDALEKLVLQWEDAPDSLVGSLLQYPGGLYQQVGTKINWWTGSSKGYPEKTLYNGMSVDSLTGASMLIPLSVFEKAGLLDESYFLYFEDAEFSLRCKRLGYKLLVALHSVVLHEEGATTGRKSLSTQYYFHRNRLFVLVAYASMLQRVCILFYSCFRLIRAIVKSALNSSRYPWQEVKVQIFAMLDFWKGVRGQCLHQLKL